MSNTLESQMTLSWPSACIALLPLALNAVLADTTPLLGRRGASALWRISPVVCLYDVVWKLVGLLLLIRPRRNAQLDVDAIATSLVQTVMDAKVDPAIPSDPEKLAVYSGIACSPAPLSLAEEDESSRQSPIHLTVAKWALHVISVTQAVKVMACDGVMWMQIFTMIYLCHWFLATFAPQPKSNSNNTTTTDLHHRLTKTTFQSLIHLLACILFIPTSAITQPQHSLLIATGFIAAFALGVVNPPSSHLPSSWISILFHYIVMAQAAIVAYTPAVVAHVSDSTTTSILVASVDGMCAVLTLLLGSQTQNQNPPGKWAARSFFACGLILPMVLSAMFWKSENTFKPEWAGWLG